MFKVQNNQGKYLEQWERVKRWYKKVLEIKADAKNKTDDDCLDEIYAFFMNCYHLKDWLKNSYKKEIENMFNKSKGIECFKVCADFVNGLKHMEASKTTRIDPNTKVKKQGVTICIQKPPHISINSCEKEGNPPSAGWKPPIIKYKWEIKSGKQYYDAFYLADECMEKWKIFLNDKKLI